MTKEEFYNLLNEEVKTNKDYLETTSSMTIGRFIIIQPMQNGQV